MTSTTQITADQLSRGKNFWAGYAARLDASARKINSNIEPDRFSRFMDAMTHARNVAALCPTFGPCSRLCVGR